jgi:hypothetical protein
MSSVRLPDHHERVARERAVSGDLGESVRLVVVLLGHVVEGPRLAELVRPIDPRGGVPSVGVAAGCGAADGDQAGGVGAEGEGELVLSAEAAGGYASVPRAELPEPPLGSADTCPVGQEVDRAVGVDLHVDGGAG